VFLIFGIWLLVWAFPSVIRKLYPDDDPFLPGDPRHE
jgi:hypothetical protein